MPNSSLCHVSTDTTRHDSAESNHMQKSSILVVSIILLVLGVIGLVSSFSTFLMWALVILGIIGLAWGWFSKGKEISK